MPSLVFHPAPLLIGIGLASLSPAHSANMRSTVVTSRPPQRSHSRSPSKLPTPKKQPSKPTCTPPSTLPQHHAFHPQPPPTTATTPLSPAARAHHLHTLHLQHNGQLLLAIEKEEQRELRRDALLAATRDDAERWRLEGSFGLERGEASERLAALGAELEVRMAVRMEELGMIGGWDSGAAAYGGEWEEKKQLSANKKKPSTNKARGRAG